MTAATDPDRAERIASSITDEYRKVWALWIAACCLAHQVPLATLNLKDYEDFRQYHGLHILGTE